MHHVIFPKCIHFGMDYLHKQTYIIFQQQQPSNTINNKNTEFRMPSPPSSYAPATTFPAKNKV